MNSFFDFQKEQGRSLLSTSTHGSVTEFPSISLNIPRYPQKRLHKRFWLCQGSKYAWSSFMFDRILKISLVPKKAGFWIWRGCICKGYLEFRIFLIRVPYTSRIPKYASKCLNVPQYAWKWPNIPEFSWIGQKMPE